MLTRDGERFLEILVVCGVLALVALDGTEPGSGADLNPIVESMNESVQVDVRDSPGIWVAPLQGRSELFMQWSTNLIHDIRAAAGSPGHNVSRGRC